MNPTVSFGWEVLPYTGKFPKNAVTLEQILFPFTPISTPVPNPSLNRLADVLQCLKSVPFVDEKKTKSQNNNTKNIIKTEREENTQNKMRYKTFVFEGFS